MNQPGIDHTKTSAPASDDARKLNRRGVALAEEGRLDEALASFKQAVALHPAWVGAHLNIGLTLAEQGRLDEAIVSYRQVLVLNPGNADAHFKLANALYVQNRYEEALTSFERVVALQPKHGAAHNNLGATLKALGRVDAAIASYEQALAISPIDADAHCNLGAALMAQSRIAEAIACFERALALNPHHAEAHGNLGLMFVEQGLIDEALTYYRQALALRPDYSGVHTKLIFAMNFDPSSGPEEQQKERARWYEMHGQKFARAIAPHPNLCDPERRLRIGYVSAHFRHQAATYAFTPVLLNHDSTQFEIFCYSDTAEEDDLTARLCASTTHWRRVVGRSDDELAAMIRSDRIDILVDLAGHMGGDRLLVFARKPAPVQATGWGEPTGTGLATMDYLFGDPILIPAAQRSLLSERVIDLPCFISFWEPEQLPPAGPLPAMENGYVTFGSFSRVTKLSVQVLRLWAAILRHLPKSRLVLKDIGLDNPAVRKRISEALHGEDISVDRVTLLGPLGRSAHFAAYRAVDVALDPFPHSGGMTTLDALCMGLPVITCPGLTISSRLASASLSALGLDRFIARDYEQYVRLAIGTASDLHGLARLRGELRDRLVRLPVGNAVLYTRAVESAYRTIWRQWCRKVGSEARVG
jgi:predicted O-linked N-acetylglucosamine transferase (SPINDLY family)